MTYIPPKYLSMDECKDRHLYRLNSRNLEFGVYRAGLKGFIGLREKFGDIYPATEFHRDDGGTVRPMEELPEVLPEGFQLNEGFAGCELCKKPVRCVPGEVTYPGKAPQQVPCEHNEHEEPSDCPAASKKHFGVFWRNTDLAAWLEGMEKKYALPRT
jgi:hypothetical protein